MGAEEIKRTSRAHLGHVQSTGTVLADCLTRQHHYISISVDSAAGQRVLELAMSYDQFVRFMTSNGSVPVTLQHYVEPGTGKSVKDEVPDPESIMDRAQGRFGEAGKEIGDRLADIKRDLYEMVNSAKAPGKKALGQLLQDVDVALSFYRSNLAYVVKQATEEISSAQAQAQAQLSMFLGGHGLDVAAERLASLLSPPDRLALPEGEADPAAPPTGYVVKERAGKPVDDMTAAEVGDRLSEVLRRFEAALKGKYIDGDTARPHLFLAGAHGTGNNKVSVMYISYQGSTALGLLRAREYLKFLLTLKDPNDFKSHFQFFRETDE